MATKPSDSKQAKRHVELLERVKEIQQSAKGSHWIRIGLLVDVFEDPGFRAEVAGDDFAVAEHLDPYCDDIGFGFLELRAIFKRWPDQVTWTESRLVDLYEQARQPTPAEQDAPRRPRRSVKLAEHEALIERCKQLEAAIKKLENERQWAKDECEQLRTQVKRMQAQLGEQELAAVA